MTTFMLISSLQQNPLASSHRSTRLTVLSSTFPDTSVAIGNFTAESHFFHSNGFSMVKQVYSREEIHLYRETIRLAMKSGPKKATDMAARDAFTRSNSSSKDFKLADALWSRYPQIKPLVESRTLRTILFCISSKAAYI